MAILVLCPSKSVDAIDRAINRSDAVIDPFISVDYKVRS